MSYQEAFEALNNGDYLTAVPLLDKAARETEFSSDFINHAFTLALYRAGNNSRLADVSFNVGNALLQNDPASAMDYFQRAIFAGLDAKRVRQIGEVFERWSVQGPRTPLQDPVDRVAHVVGCLSPSEMLTPYLKVLVASLRKQGIESSIFTTEWSSSWFFNPAGKPQSEPVPISANVKIASIDGDFAERAARIAQDIRASGIQVAFFHAGLQEQITARVASMRPVALQVNVNHGKEMDADLFDGRIHLFKHAIDRSRFSSHPAEWIPSASDIEARLQVNSPVTRQGMGLDSATTVSATFGDLKNVAGGGFLRVLSEILKRFPNHFHLFAGAGNVKMMRSHLHSEGVLPRIRFLGQVADVAPLLNVIDVYLASFPQCSEQAILEAMGAGKPVVTLRSPGNSEHNSGAELVGIRELTAPGEGDYLEIADRLLRNPPLCRKQGHALLDRFRAEFRPERLGERYKAFLGRFGCN